ncbi:hypothetical protein AVEN_88308-1 [Araneus ventricosus]|uniref:Tc1-like transposase DDE domain-containing protein n=1 Tax=Araneus ventricosus TaxID=182803 RepID=A0A4Y2R649_ARAVE|nr:hypothetical protein AVEN_88308-1 [Araneus ventricosus]
MIWREQGTRYRAPNIVERDHYRGGGLLVWAGIATNGRSDLYVFAGGSVEAGRYRDEILHSLLRPSIAAMGTDAIFMDDNALPHKHDSCEVIWRVKPFHRWHGLLDHRT